MLVESSHAGTFRQLAIESHILWTHPYGGMAKLREEGEARPNFLDVEPSNAPVEPYPRIGTGTIPTGSAGDIFLRNAPLNEATVSEIARMAGPRSFITVSLPQGTPVTPLYNALPSGYSASSTTFLASNGVYQTVTRIVLP